MTEVTGSSPVEPTTDMKSTAYYIKTYILLMLLFGESLFLTHTLLEYVKTQKYFAPPLDLAIKIGLLLLLLLYTQALTIGAWYKKEQYLIVPIPIALGIAIVMFPINYVYAQIALVVSFLLLLSYMVKATYIMELLTKFKPRLILRVPSKGILFVFSLAAAILTVINPIDQTFDPAKKLSEIVNNQVMRYVEKDATLGPLMNFGMLNLNIANEVENQINQFIEPYRGLFVPLIALVVFALIRSIGFVVNLIYSLTIGGLFLIVKKTGFFRIETEQITRERLKF